MVRPVNVLMVEDNEDDARLLQLELSREGFLPDVTRVDTSHDLRAALAEGRYDVVISDHNMPGFSGDEALAMVKRFNPDIPFIVVSGTRGEEHAVEALGATRSRETLPVTTTSHAQPRPTGAAGRCAGAAS